MLAAGRSSRLGRNKLLVMIDGEPMVRRAVLTAVDAGLAPVIVVTGHDQDRVRRALADLDVVFAENPDPESPPGRSFKIGLAQVTGVAGALLILPDMIQVSAPMLRAVADAVRLPDTRLVLSRYGDIEAPPHGVHVAAFHEVLTASDAGVLRDVRDGEPGQTRYVDWPIASLRDIDTEADVTELG